ncbi:MAG: phytanoyl-CoA dioxygenase family protein [Armatimonadetes bacterium]|nr:phytanoyl-CoA dioxygenase family protein [Armatimonadota bacterium]
MRSTLERPVEETPLTPEQRKRFDSDGFLVIEDALSPEMLDRLLAATDRLYQRGLRDEGLTKTNKWDLRNCIVEDDAFFDLLTYPKTFPLVVDLLGWNIKLITSHLIVRAPSPPDADEHWKGEGWHRDGGGSSSDMTEPHPRLFLKIAYFLTDLTEKGRGSIRFVPGSNRLMGRPAQGEGMPDPYGAVEIQCRPGTAVLFEQRTWHAVGPNHSEITRKGVFMGYGYRWIQPMDFIEIPARLIEKADPIQAQMLGKITHKTGFYLPKEEDIPLKKWAEARKAMQGVTPESSNGSSNGMM